MNAWVLDKAKPLGQILVEQGGLLSAKRDLLEPLVAAHLDLHGGNPEKSLAALAIPSPLRHELRSLADAEVQASVAYLSTPPDPGRPALEPTTGYQPPQAGARYQVLRPHAKGGVGEVFVALDEELHREVALKEIDAKHAHDAHSRGRFVREAEITGGLEHPGIVPVYGLGLYGDGRPFYAMRFIQGETLKEATRAAAAWTLGIRIGAISRPRVRAGAHPRIILDGLDERPSRPRDSGCRQPTNRSC
jgi:hypothetical protein